MKPLQKDIETLILDGWKKGQAIGHIKRGSKIYYGVEQIDDFLNEWNSTHSQRLTVDIIEHSAIDNLKIVKRGNKPCLIYYVF